MKKLFITLFAAMACLACFTISNADTSTPRENTTDTLKELTYKAYMVSSCDDNDCYERARNIVRYQAPSSYMMLFKLPDNRWLFEKEGSVSKLTGIPIKRMVVLTDKIEINKKKYKKVKYVVIVE